MPDAHSVTPGLAQGLPSSQLPSSSQIADGAEPSPRAGDASSHDARLTPVTPDLEGVDIQSLVDQLKDLASNPPIDQQPDKLAELGAVLLKLAASKQEERASSQDLSPYTDAAILYQHVLSICEKHGQEKLADLADVAHQKLAQIQALMLAQAKGEAPEAIRVKEARIRKDKEAQLEAIRKKARQDVASLAASRDKQGSKAEVEYIVGSKKLFEEIAEAIQSLLANFYQESEQALGPAPCKYAVIGLGSLALQQTTPYSDLEFAILMDDAGDEATAETWRAYFRKLTHLVHFRVIYC